MDTFEFTLEAKAKKSGGDKFVCTTDSTFVIYVPQAVSRKKTDLKNMTVTFTMH